MSKIGKICLFCLSLCVLVPLCLFLTALCFIYPDSNFTELENVSVKYSDSVKYFEIDGSQYYSVDYDSVQKGYFDESVYYRLSRTIDDFDYESIEEVYIPDDFCSRYAKIAVNSEDTIYYFIKYDGEYGSVYAKQDLKLPEISAKDIFKMDVFVYDGTDDRAVNPLFTYTSCDEIDYFLSHYKDFTAKYTADDRASVACFVRYKNYNVEEQLYEDDFERLVFKESSIL